jgi:S-adenosylmethionine hydrolase
MLELPTALADGDMLVGQVLRADRFGNIVTTIDRRTFDAFVAGRPFSLEVADRPVARLVGTYAEIGEDEVCALFGSADLLELAARSARASDRIDAPRGARVTVSKA